MRSTIWGITVVMFLSLALCIGTMIAVENVVTDMQSQREEAVRLVREGEIDGAEAQLGEMIEDWHQAEWWLSAFIGHEDLHEVTQLLAESEILLSAGERDDFYRSMVNLKERINHLYEEQSLKLVNIL